MIKYCTLCQRNVNADKKISLLWWAVWTIGGTALGGFVGFCIGINIYAWYYLLKPKVCTICGGKV